MSTGITRGPPSPPQSNQSATRSNIVQHRISALLDMNPQHELRLQARCRSGESFMIMQARAHQSTAPEVSQKGPLPPSPEPPASRQEPHCYHLSEQRLATRDAL